MNLSDQLKLKIRLEERFRKEVRALFNRIRIEYRISVSTRSWIRASRYTPQWIALLQKHYSRVQKAFKGIAKDDTKEIEDEETLAALLLWADINSQESGKEIINTTQRNMDRSAEQARQSFSDEGNFEYSQRDLAVASTVILGRKFRGRESSIIMTETQKAAESTKLIDAFSVAGLEPEAAVTGQSVQPVKAKKEWQDVGDKDVRTGHHAREVKAVAIDKPFIVNGQQLMYPGDRSRGASASNTVNCRCGSFYTNLDQRPSTQITDEPVTIVEAVPPQPSFIVKPPNSNLISTRTSKPVLTGGKPPTKKPFKAPKPNTDDFVKTGDFTRDEKRYVKWYANDGFKDVNDYMRNPTSFASQRIERIKELNKFKANVSTAISKVKITENITVYRGIESGAFKNLVRTRKINELSASGFQSTSLSPIVAEKFSEANGVILRINVKKGTKALNLGKQQLGTMYEAEVLLDEGKYIIKKSPTVERIARDLDKRRTFLDVDYIPN